jgi:hypothetical protein
MAAHHTVTDQQAGSSRTALQLYFKLPPPEKKTEKQRQAWSLSRGGIVDYL